MKEYFLVVIVDRDEAVKALRERRQLLDVQITVAGQATDEYLEWLAMTGEITLRGRVWPIAGLKEKLLAALRGGIKTVLIPEENAKDLVEISNSIKKGLDIVPVSRMDEVLARALTRKPEPIEWDDTTAAVASEATPVEEEAWTLTAH